MGRQNHLRLPSSYTLTINCQTITVTNPVTNTGTAGVAFSQTFTQSGAHGAATFSTASTLPTGLSLSTAGVLAGTPGQIGSFPTVVTVTDANSCTGTGATYNLTIVCPTITVTRTGGGSFPAGIYNTAYTGQSVTASGSSGFTFGVTVGALPTGLSLAMAGAISGTPTATGAFTFTVTATDQYGCTGSQAFTIHIKPNAVDDT